MLKRRCFCTMETALQLLRERNQNIYAKSISVHSRYFSEVINSEVILEDEAKNGKLKFTEYNSGPSFAEKIILQADKYGTSLVQCVSSDFVMDKGLEKYFKKAFGNVQYLRDQGIKPGRAAVLPYKDCFIYYLITRESWWDRGCYKYLRSAIADVRDHCEANSVKDLRMGRLASGPDGLDWMEVREIVKNTFKDTDITIIAQITR